MANTIAARVPRGIVCMWGGFLADIPAGWAICDGANGTPDLTGKFVLCYDPVTYPTLGATGGYTDGQILTHTHAASFSLGSSSVTHNHTGTTDGDLPPHTHTYVNASTYNPGSSGLNPGVGYGAVDRQTSSPSNVHTHTFASAYDVHSHTISGYINNAAPVGSVSVTGRNMPPYYVTVYIMKT
jgi:hypothetical protein